MSRILQLQDCAFYAEPNAKGYFVGRCRQYPDLRTKPRRNKLDALDEIVGLTSEKIRDLDLASPKPVNRNA